MSDRGPHNTTLALALIAAIAVGGAAFDSGPAAAQAASTARKSGGGGSLLPGANSRDPVNIEAGKLDYFDKEQKLVYSGEVVAKQGDSILRASVLTIFLSKDAKAAGGEASGLSAGDAKQAGNSIRRMEAAGPVTVQSEDEVGTGDNGSYDKADNKITLLGNVTLSQGTNVIKGDKLVYDMDSGQAQVSSGQTLGRVKSVFTPGSGSPGGTALGGESTRKSKHEAGVSSPSKIAPLPLAPR